MTENAGLGHNDPQRAAEIADIHDKIKAFQAKAEVHKAAMKKELKEANALRKKLPTLGVSLKAYRLACELENMQDDNRADFDASYLFIRDAIGLPVQGDLFADGGGDDDTGADAD